MAKLAAIFEEMGDEVRRDMCRRRLAGIREARGRKEVAMKKIMEATPASESTPHDATHRDTAPIYRSEELFQGKRELFIIHGGEVYRLIRTRNDRLILQK